MTMQPLPVGGDPKPKSISAKISAWLLHAAADYWIAVVGKEKRCDGNHGAVGMDLLSVVGHSSV